MQRLVKAVLEVGFPSVDEARRRKLQDRMCLLLAGMVTADGRMDIAQEVRRGGCGMGQCCSQGRRAAGLMTAP